MKNLIVTADDYGVFPSINDGIKKAILNNKVNSVACIANYKDSVKNVKDLIAEIGSKADIGCHLTISSGDPLTVKGNDIFCYGNNFRPFSALNIDAIEAVPELLEKELKAQVQTFLDSGIAVTNLSCHHTTLTTTAGLFKVYLKVAEDLKLPIRSVNLSPNGKDCTFRTVLDLMLMRYLSLKKLEEVREFGRDINVYYTNFETKILAPNILECSHYGPIPQAGFLDAFAKLEINHKHKKLDEFFKNFIANDKTCSELMLHLITDDINLLATDDGIDYPGIDQNYFDSRALEFTSINSYDLTQHPEITMGFWRELA